MDQCELQNNAAGHQSVNLPHSGLSMSASMLAISQAELPLFHLLKSPFCRLLSLAVALVLSPVIITLIIPVSSAASADTSMQPGAYNFVAEKQVLLQLNALQQKAAAEQKLLLLVLGAQWCHDSVELLRHFNQPALSAALEQRYEMAFIDVGYLQFGQAITERYQLPLYYGTPTVMIIAPDSGQLLNKTDLMHWTNAASFDDEAYQQYFIATDFQQQFATAQQQFTGISPAHVQQINSFELQQAKKLAQAYQQLGPVLQAYKRSDKPASAEFKQLWEEVKGFRSSILPDVQQLQQQAISLKPGETLVLPSYPAFSFTKD